MLWITHGSALIRFFTSTTGWNWITLLTVNVSRIVGPLADVPYDTAWLTNTPEVVVGTVGTGAGTGAGTGTGTGTGTGSGVGVVVVVDAMMRVESTCVLFASV